jgi:hypothetical protein
LQGGLDDQNQLDPAQQIRFYAQAVTTAQPSSSLRKHCESTDDVLLTKNGYLLALRFFAVFRFFAAFFGTFAPPRLASDRAIAIACLRLLTLRPERPLFSVPALRSLIARATLAEAIFEYFRAMTFLPLERK